MVFTGAQREVGNQEMMIKDTKCQSCRVNKSWRSNLQHKDDDHGQYCIILEVCKRTDLKSNLLGAQANRHAHTHK